MPRLSWRRNTGPDDMARESHPLYIQEKVDPSWFVNHLIDQTDTEQTHLFAFNGFPEDAKYNWYRHKGNWSNRLIHGDASRVMASFLHREGLKGQVQMIYFDPPYGIKFDSMFQVSTKKTKGGPPSDGKSKKAFRDTYKDGMHSYLDSIYRIAAYSRLLLKDTGSFFLQISSEHLHRVAIILDEVFGAENRIATIPFATTGASSSKLLPDVATWLLWYAKNKEQLKFYKLYLQLKTRKEQLEHMSYAAMVETVDGKIRVLSKDEKNNPELLPQGSRLFRLTPLTSQGESKTGRSEPFVWKGIQYDCPRDQHWSVSHAGLNVLGKLGRLAPTKGGLHWKKYSNEVPGRQINNIWHTQMAPSDKHFIVETAESVIERCVLMATDPGDLVIDPTCGSGTTASVAEKWGRRWITIDINPVQISLCRQRIITSINDWYLTQDSAEGRHEEAKLAGLDVPAGSDAADRQYDPGSGFVYERVPYVSAATLAYDLKRDAVLLVDRPLEKRGMKRISSPFTVESVSPHKYVSPQEYTEDQKYVFATILEGIGVSGVIVPGTGGGRWHLEDANTWPNGRILTHQVRIRETGEQAAMVLLPDDNTGGVNLINEAAEEALQYPRIRRVFILAFEFEAAAYGRQTEQRGKLNIHKIKINNDLALKELMHKENDSSFVMLGEPDVDVQPDGNKWTVQIQGYDTFDPLTGGLKHGSADTVDCWLVDTNYDGQSFFARRIHLPDKSNDRQVKKFKTKLAGRVNPVHWNSMLSLKSMPFEAPKTGRIAVRVITEYGEIMTTIHKIPGNAA